MPEITVPLHLPELAPGVWVQGPPVSLAFARGAVVLVEFWESTCVHCLRTLPYVAAWHERYAPRGLVVVGVHTPEFDLSSAPAAVAATVAELGVSYPVLLDADRATWRLFANHFWPARYLADARGYLRWEHFGEGAYGETERWIQRLLREAGEEGPFPQPLAPLRPEDRPGAVCHDATRELYAGYHRGRLVSPEGYRPEEEVEHRLPPAEPLAPGALLAHGRWFHAAEHLEARQEGAALALAADAAGIHAVLSPGSDGREVTVAVERDGGPLPPRLRGPDVVEEAGETVVRVARGRSFHLLAGSGFQRHALRLVAREAGLRVWTLSFTTCVMP